MKVEVNYPVIILPKKDNMIYVFFKDKDLKSTSESLLKKIDYLSLEIIDSLGYKFKIKKAFKIKYRGLWGFNPLLKGKQILIDFEYSSEVEKILLDDFKEEILRRIDKKRKFWETGWDFQSLKEKVAQSSTFSAIAVLLK